MKMKQARQIFRDAILLTAASLLMRTVGIAFHVAISNRAGAETMGLYTLMAGVYGFSLTMATSGIHLGVTRLVAELLSYGATDQIKRFMKIACTYAAVCGGLAALALYIFSAPIGTYLLSDSRTVLSFRLFALSLPFIALSSVFGGYYTAMRKSYKNAALQIAEQFVKITLTMYLLAMLSNPDTESLLCALVLGGVLSEFFSFFANTLLFFFEKKSNPNLPHSSCPSYGSKELMKITLPMAFTSYIRSALLSLQHILIPQSLRRYGASHAAALASYGCIHSMTLPVILYPAALISSFSGLLIPAMAESHAQNRKIQIRYMVSRVWFFSMLFSIGMAGILICFSDELGQLLYPNTDTGKYIRILAPLIPIMYLDTATDAMLKGLGEQVYSMKINVADALISVVCVFVLVPIFGISGYVATIYISETFNTVCSVTKLLCMTKISTQLLKWVYLPLICILIATYSAKMVFEKMPLISSANARSILHCGVTLMIYFGLLLITHTINREELSWGRGLLLRDSDSKSVTKTVS